MTALELVRTIVNLKSGGRPTDDTSISDSQWMFICDYYRSQIIRQQQERGQTVSQFIEQEIYLPLKLSEFDDTLYESVNIPKPIELYKKDLITHVGGDEEIGYQRHSFNSYQWKRFSKYTKYLPYYFVKDSKVLVGNLGGNKDILIRGVFERPIEVEKMKETYSVMSPFSFIYPMSSNMIDTMIKMIADTEMKVLYMLPKDNANDSQDLP